MDGTVNAIITSKNVEKIQAVRRAFVFSGINDISLHSIPSDSGIPHGQPWGLQHTYEGASARIHDVRAFHSDQVDQLPSPPEYVVSVENGVCAIVTHTMTSAIDVCCVIVENFSTGERAFSFSQSRPYPLSDVQEKIQNQ